jgi:hypothetical protein
MKYRITYEKIDPLGPLGGDGQTSRTTIEARNMIDATMKALTNANKNERVKAVEGPPG